MPFDWKNPLGFAIAIGLELAMVSFTMRYMSYMVSLGIGLYSFGILFANGIRGRLISFKEKIRDRTPRSELLDHFCESIRLSYLRWLSAIANFKNKLQFEINSSIS